MGTPIVTSCARYLYTGTSLRLRISGVGAFIIEMQGTLHILNCTKGQGSSKK